MTAPAAREDLRVVDWPVHGLRLRVEVWRVGWRWIATCDGLRVEGGRPVNLIKRAAVLAYRARRAAGRVELSAAAG